MAPVIGPASDGGLLVQNVHNDQAAQVNLTKLPSSKVLPVTQTGAATERQNKGPARIVHCQGQEILSTDRRL